MATKKKLTINELCEMESRGETCPELEEAHKQMASAVDNFRTVGLPDSMKHDELPRNIGLDTKLDQFEKAILDNPVTKLSRELETMNLGRASSLKHLTDAMYVSGISDQFNKAMLDSPVTKLRRELETMNLGMSSSLKHLTDAMNVSGIAGLGNTLAEIDRRHVTEIEKIRETYFGGSHHRSSIESLIKDAQEQSRAQSTFSSARLMPMIDPCSVFPDVEVNTIQQEIVDATREQNESMRENFALLIEQMKTQTTNSEKLLQISIAATEGNIASKKRNDIQFEGVKRTV